MITAECRHDAVRFVTAIYNSRIKERQRIVQISSVTRGVPAAKRRRVDLRLLAGFALVIASTAGAYFFVSATNSTVEVYVARETLLAGDPVRESELKLVAVNVSNLDGAYIEAGSLGQSPVALRTIAVGEMIPTRAIGPVSSVTMAKLVVSIAEGLPEDTSAGTNIDLWATFSDPYSSVPSSSAIVVPGATFVRTIESDAYAIDSQQRVELMVPRSSLRTLLAAQGDGASLIAVPTVRQAG